MPSRRPSLPPDTPWQQEMEDAFPYQETPDQLSAIEDIKKDLEDDKPMDRLICGDVGYGKTEVAIRAAFKVASSGRQVAVLCPTTILAQQHLNTFRQRLAAYPVKIELLSRFVSKSEATQTVKGLDEGTVDIVIGTHKLLGKDVKFRNLGLLVVDEEQRFGVAHKERIKNFRKSVDVLTLSATPIPRTLHMSLSGIRDMSLIDDPPEGRKPIKTYVKEYDDELVREVVLRELDRGGQIYFLHNRVESISHIAEKLRRLVPSAKVEYAHGQMHADDLEEVMVRFDNGEFNILVCTTIVESGLDISNVNTIIVDNADRLGPAQLYQLRGRIGRSNRQGYAYLLYRKDKMLTEVAEKRLSALREFSDLGSGYKVALRDLEIRGAGNLLGAEQSGTVATVGFDLYTQLLSQAINELKGEDMDSDFELPNIALPLDAFIPERYIPSEAERILMYKKLTAVRQNDDVARIQEELEDRYGDPPRSVWNLLAIMRLRLRCQEVGIGSIVAEKRRVAVRFAGTHLTRGRHQEAGPRLHAAPVPARRRLPGDPGHPGQDADPGGGDGRGHRQGSPPEGRRPHGQAEALAARPAAAGRGQGWQGRERGGRCQAPPQEGARRRRQGPRRQDGGSQNPQPGEQPGVGPAARHVQPALARGLETPAGEGICASHRGEASPLSEGHTLLASR